MDSCKFYELLLAEISTMKKPNYTDLASYLEYKKQTMKLDSDLFGDLFKTNE